MVPPRVPPAVHTDGVVVVKLTDSPELAVALTWNAPDRSLRFGSVAKLIVWLALDDTVKLRVTGGAALNVLLPAWEAVMEQVPAAARLMVAPFVPPDVHTPGVDEANVTGNPELAMALTANGGSPSTLSGSVPKVIV